MREPRRSTINPSGENEHNYEIDLNDPQFQERLFNYFRNGVPASDARGHSAHLQMKVTPIQADVLESIRSKAPKNLWRTQSEMLRSMLSVGCLVSLQILKQGCQTLERDFKLLELINQVEKNTREAELYADVQRSIFEMNTQRFDMSSKVSEIENLMEKRKTASK